MRTVHVLMACLLLIAVKAGQVASTNDLQVNRHSCNGPGEEAYSVLAASARDKAATFFCGDGVRKWRNRISPAMWKSSVHESRLRKRSPLNLILQKRTYLITSVAPYRTQPCFVVSKEIYKENFTQLYGAEGWEDAEYEKLMTHEMIHSAHAIVARRLFGTEDGMGPPWLFEGMAIVASGQLPTSEAELNKITGDDFK